MLGLEHNKSTNLINLIQPSCPNQTQPQHSLDETQSTCSNPTPPLCTHPKQSYLLNLQSSSPCRRLTTPLITVTINPLETDEVTFIPESPDYGCGNKLRRHSDVLRRRSLDSIASLEDLKNTRGLSLSR